MARRSTTLSKPGVRFSLYTSRPHRSSTKMSRCLAPHDPHTACAGEASSTKGEVRGSAEGLKGGALPHPTEPSSPPRALSPTPTTWNAVISRFASGPAAVHVPSASSQAKARARRHLYPGRQEGFE